MRASSQSLRSGHAEALFPKPREKTKFPAADAERMKEILVGLRVVELARNAVTMPLFVARWKA